METKGDDWPHAEMTPIGVVPSSIHSIRSAPHCRMSPPALDVAHAATLLVGYLNSIALEGC
jgi:hypothetical protein